MGQRIGEVAGRDMKRLLLELGGKGAGIVFDDADLKTAIGAIASVWAFHSGQICTAPTRVLAQRGIYDQLVERPGGGGRAPQGRRPARAPTPCVGPVITDAAPRPGRGLHRRPGATQGATVVAGGERPELDRGFYVAPTLLADCRIDMKVVQEEIFGPVVVVIPFDDEDEAVALANATEFGLYDYVFSGDTARAYDGGPAAAHRQRRHQHRAAQPRDALRRVQDERRRSRRRRFGFHAYSELQSIVWPG